MARTTEQRYGDVAVIFHWLIAFFIIGLLAIGKYMTSLEDNDPVRFVLTQWHKSFGLTVLFLSVLRLVWRFTHRPPPELGSIPHWQQRVASAAHTVLYLLMFILPITGWIMASASPLNIDTVLFNVITIPHLPPFAELSNKAEIAESFHEYHELAGNLLILILLAHIGAAVKHHLIDKDTILLRMLPDWASRSFKTKIAALSVAVVASTAGLMLYAANGNEAALLAAGESEVSFIADVTGDLTPGQFADTQVTASIDTQNPENSSIVAVVNTTSVSSDNTQVEGSLPDPEWFDINAYPEARFESTSITAGADGILRVEGNLTIKTTTQSVRFAMSLSDEGSVLESDQGSAQESDQESGQESGQESKQVARGEFVIDRRDFNVGMQSQSTEEYVGFDVIVRFRFDISQSTDTDTPSS